MRLCIVTDIHDRPSIERCISNRFKISPTVSRYTLNKLCDRPDLTGEKLHKHLFEHGGIDEAIRALRCEMDGEFIGLGYSAGGTAIWRATSLGLPFKAIFCVSSTRLREEMSIPVLNHVFFGSEDQGKPSARWLSKTPDRSTVFDGVGHNYYLDFESAAVSDTCAKISKDIQKIIEDR